MHEILKGKKAANQRMNTYEVREEEAEKGVAT